MLLNMEFYLQPDEISCLLVIEIHAYSKTSSRSRKKEVFSLWFLKKNSENLQDYFDSNWAEPYMIQNVQ